MPPDYIIDKALEFAADLYSKRQNFDWDAVHILNEYVFNLLPGVDRNIINLGKYNKLDAQGKSLIEAFL